VEINPTGTKAKRRVKGEKIVDKKRGASKGPTQQRLENPSKSKGNFKPFFGVSSEGKKNIFMLLGIRKKAQSGKRGGSSGSFHFCVFLLGLRSDWSRPKEKGQPPALRLGGGRSFGPWGSSVILGKKKTSFLILSCGGKKRKSKNLRVCGLDLKNFFSNLLCKGCCGCWWSLPQLGPGKRWVKFAGSPKKHRGSKNQARKLPETNDCGVVGVWWGGCYKSTCLQRFPYLLAKEGKRQHERKQTGAV